MIGSPSRRLPLELNLSRQIRSIALINPLPDFGISQYTYELAEGLAANGVRVDVYANDLARSEDADLPRRHRYLPVLGSLLLRQKAILRNGTSLDHGRYSAAGPAAQSTEPGSEPQPDGTRHHWRTAARNCVLTAELAWHLKRSRYDLVWTQWPVTGPGGQYFWRLAKRLGLRIAHTVHNVLPHDERPGDVRRCGSVYHACDALFVHSTMALREMDRLFPEVAAKTRVMNHGLYTLYARRPEARDATRIRLGVGREQVALLAFGPIKPYKNVDAILAALAAPCDQRTVLVVAGQESGYPDLVPGDPLGHTRRLASQLGVADRVRLVPRGLDFGETTEVFEAADALVLPYPKSYGSGALLLGMTFGRFVIARRTGGMDEYLRSYPAHELLETGETDELVAAIDRAVRRVSGGEGTQPPSAPELQWSNIAKSALRLLGA